jgi:hypothetical protein
MLVISELGRLKQDDHKFRGQPRLHKEVRETKRKIFSRNNQLWGAIL